MKGLERNADVVSMASYAPLFAHADGWQWTPDLIWVNNLLSYGTPDYYVQKLFSLNKGTAVVPITLKNEAVAGQDSLYASAVKDSLTDGLIIKIINASAKPQPVIISFEGIRKVDGKALLTIMLSDSLNVENSFVEPQKISPQEETIIIKGKKINMNLLSYSFSVIRIKKS